MIKMRDLILFHFYKETVSDPPFTLCSWWEWFPYFLSGKVSHFVSFLDKAHFLQNLCHFAGGFFVG